MVEKTLTCHFYGKPGGCRYGDSCKFQHGGVANGGASTSSSAPASAIAPTRPPSIVHRPIVFGPARITACQPHINAKNINQMIEPTSDYLMPITGLDPDQARDRMYTFLKPSFNFTSTFAVKTFCEILVSCNAKQSGWTMDKRTDFLDQLVRDEASGVQRMREVFKYPITTKTCAPPRVDICFQQTVLPVIMFLSSEGVVRSMTKRVQTLMLGIVDLHLCEILDAVTASLDSLMRSSMGVPALATMAQIFKPTSVMLAEYLRLFKDAAVENEAILKPFAERFEELHATWVSKIRSGLAPRDIISSLPVDEQALAVHVTGHLVRKVKDIIIRAGQKIAPESEADSRNNALIAEHTMGQLAHMQRLYEGPGELRRDGPRHDNDKVDISKIRIIPTLGELSSNAAPYIPVTVPGSPHHLLEGSYERLLDVQFRLLREEAVAPFRQGLASLLKDLQDVFDSEEAPSDGAIRLQAVLSEGGGRIHADRLDMVAADLTIHGDGHIQFKGCQLVVHSGVLVKLSFCSPKRARHNTKRYWEYASKRSLGNGSLIAYIIASPEMGARLFIGTVASYPQEMLKSVGQNRDPTISVAFFDSNALTTFFNKPKNAIELLVEANGIIYDTIAPFLRTLQTRDAVHMPFQRYIAETAQRCLPAGSVKVNPPQYALVPSFKYDLTPLLNNGAGTGGLKMSMKFESIEAAKATLQESSTFDNSQIEAVISSLTSEVALIQGPPGTGKSYTGVALVDVLLKSRVKPILIVCVTNHALDHFLRSILDKGITDNLLRFGSCSKDPKVSSFSWNSIKHTVNADASSRALNGAFKKFKIAEGQLNQALRALQREGVSLNGIKGALLDGFQGHLQQLDDTSETSPLAARHAVMQGWQVVGSTAPVADEDKLLHFWLQGGDLAFRQPKKAMEPLDKVAQQSGGPLEHQSARKEKKAPRLAYSSMRRFDWGVLAIEEPPSTATGKGHQMDFEDSDASDDEETEDSEDDSGAVKDFVDALEALEISDADAPLLEWPMLAPKHSDRSVAELMLEPNVWTYSMRERKKLFVFWEQHVKEIETDKFDRAKVAFEQARNELNEQKDQACLRVATGTDIIGCTTNGAAKLTGLLENIAPKVLLVEEAAEILEAHVLASMTRSLQHLLLIGDPMQLRPHVSNFSLSMDSKRGQLHRLDLSLMERLALEGGLPITQLNVQRRMRAEIADLVRPLYVNLQDHPDMAQRSPVKGFERNLVFMDHEHAEDKSKEVGSRSNEFEVQMAVDLVRYLCQLGYRDEGDICVLTPYLGQLSKLKRAMAKEVVNVVIDNRDEEQLALAEAADGKEAFDEAYMSVKSSTLEAAVRLATIDNFQGEEARVVILCLVRNAGDAADEDDDPSFALRKASIGFLKSPNRSNVALSRAKEGLFIMGSAELLASKSEFWASTLSTLEANGAVMRGFPLQCGIHPEENLLAEGPGQIPLWAPNGGCPQICGDNLPCGHICEKKCHPRDEKHLLYPCEAPCARLHEQCLHPCLKNCHEDCGLCKFPVPSVKLACGHTAAEAPCHEVNSGLVRCTELVEKSLQTCEHTAVVPCTADVAAYACRSSCGKLLPCCGRPCAANCDQCQHLNEQPDLPAPAAWKAPPDGVEDAPPKGMVKRIRHKVHSCSKPFANCPHKCKHNCELSHKCGECTEKCSRSCEHGRCQKACKEPCAICLVPCTWKACEHVPDDCSFPCGVPCARLPCDARCSETLICGHPCPSLCGEPCDLQKCPLCMTTEQKEGQVVDLLLQRTLDEIDLEDDSLDNIIITLDCGHVFTVETLDGLLELEKFYTRDNDGWVRPLLPSSELEKPKGCPSCRAEIHTRRHSRPIKRAVLDVQETKTTRESSSAALKLQQALNKVNLSALKVQLEEGLAELDTSQCKSSAKPRQVVKTLGEDLAAADLKSGHTGIASSATVFNAGKRGVDKRLVQLWNKASRSLKDAYDHAQAIAKRPVSPNMEAWQAAVSHAYKATAALYDFERDPRAGEKAMREAKAAVGSPAPRADYRFRIETIQQSINIRFLLQDLAGVVRDHLKRAGSAQIWNWNLFMQYLQTSSAQDAAKAIHFAEVGCCQKAFFEAQVSKLRTDIDLAKSEALSMLEITMAERAKVAQQAGVIFTDLFEGMSTAAGAFLKEATTETAAFYTGDIAPKIREMKEDAGAFVDYLATGTVYQPVSAEEKMMVTKAMNDAEFTHDGHWYRCSNGHPFAIGNCGGAMELSSCPECGVPIGGSDHALTAGNDRDRELEDLARQQGAARSPWAFRRDL